jgi:hypothetical protein
MLILSLEAVILSVLGAALRKDVKNMNEAFERWMGFRKLVAQKYYRIPLRVIVRAEVEDTAVKAVKKGPKHAYVQP